MSDARNARPGEAGYTLVALMATIAIMLVLLGAATPGWRYVMKDDREEELIFRGGEIADAIQRYQRKNGNALPPSLDVLVKGHFLRRAYKDPMMPDGKWRFLRPGEVVTAPGGGAAGATPGRAGGPGGTSSTGLPQGAGPAAGTPSPSPGATTAGGGSGSGSGPTTTSGNPLGSTIQGVASRNTDESLRIFNGRDRYSDWLFIPGQPRVIGQPVTPVLTGAPGGARPGATPAPAATSKPM